MGQEYFINSQALQNKINQLLPSQGGAGAGLDLSSTTQIVPIVDLTETAEGSDVRADLQTAFAFDNITEFLLTSPATTVIANTPGYYKILANFQIGTSQNGRIELTDGVSTKILIRYAGSSGGQSYETIETIVFLRAGDSCQVLTTGTSVVISGSIRQIADIDGNLIDP